MATGVVVVGAVAAIVYLFFPELVGSGAPFVKAVPVALLSVWVFRASAGRPQRLSAVGLLVAALADSLITFTFLGGLVGFLVAHVLYVFAFISVESRPRLARLIPIAIWAAIALPYLASRAGAMAIPIVVYGLVIFAMIWRAAAALSSLGWNPGTLGIAGALFFGLSDTLLGYARFAAPFPGSSVFIMGTYWAAQALIATSFVMRAKDRSRGAEPPPS